MTFKIPYINGFFMSHFISSFHEGWRILRKDKTIFLMGLAPIVIGVIIFYFLGNYIFGDLHELGTQYIESKFGGGKVSGFFSSLIFVAVGVIFWFLVNFCFVLVVSFMASPFNDAISSRVEKIVLGDQTHDASNIIRNMINRWAKVIFNEFKKVLFIIFISCIGLVIGFFFPPAGFAISGFLLAISFVDYSWARRELSFRECLRDSRKAFFAYILSGMFFLFLLGIPIVNLLALPYGVIYYTVLFVKRQATT